MNRLFAFLHENSIDSEVVDGVFYLCYRSTKIDIDSRVGNALIEKIAHKVSMDSASVYDLIVKEIPAETFSSKFSDEYLKSCNEMPFEHENSASANDPDEHSRSEEVPNALESNDSDENLDSYFQDEEPVGIDFINELMRNGVVHENLRCDPD